MGKSMDYDDFMSNSFEMYVKDDWSLGNEIHFHAAYAPTKKLIWIMGNPSDDSIRYFQSNLLIGEDKIKLLKQKLYQDFRD